MQSLQEVTAQLAAHGIACRQRERMCHHTTFQIGGEAALFVEPATAEELRQALEIIRLAGMRCYLLGKGSNVLFSDEGFDGVVVHVGQALGAVRAEGNCVTACAGASLAAVCTAAAEAGLVGLAFAYGIPGCVGGAVYMNAGAYGGEMKDVLDSVTFLDETGCERTLPATELALGYRMSAFQTHAWCILEARFRLVSGDKEEILRQMQDYASRRAEKQPLDMPSAGSTFKRPEGAFAGALIDACGLRGFAVGGAAISTKHCGFVVNQGGATCADVLALTDEVCRVVKEKTGYTLEKEIRVVR